MGSDFAHALPKTLLLAAAISLWLVSLACAHAAAFPVHGAPGIDLVLIIDQSGSMSGHPEHPAPNDKNGHRISIAKSIVLSLAQDTASSTRTHRVAVVEFGAPAINVPLEQTALGYDPADPGAQLRALESKLDALLKVKELNYTDTPGALRRGLTVLGSSVPSATSDSQRRRIALLITDGKPYVSGRTTAELERQVRDAAKAYRDAGVELWVLGINDSDRYWENGWGKVWADVATPGGARVAEYSYPHIALITRQFLDSWLGVEGARLHTDTIDVPPYQRRLMFQAHYSDISFPLEIRDPDGLPLPPSAGATAMRPAMFNLFAIDNPRPGIYRIVRPTSLRAEIFAFFYGPQLVRTNPPPVVDRGTPAAIGYQLSGARPDQPFEVADPRRLTAQVRIVDPDGGETTLPAEVKTDGRIQAQWAPQRTGVYRLLPAVALVASDGTRRNLLTAEGMPDARVEVTDRETLALDLTQPDPARRIGAFRSFLLALRLVDVGDGHALALADVVERVGDPATWLDVVELDATGVRLAHRAPITLTPRGDLFAAEIPVEINWASGEGWLRPAIVNLRVEHRPLRGDARFQGILLPSGAEGFRVASDAMTIGGLRVSYPLWVVVGLAVLVSIGLGLLAWLVIAFGIPRWMIVAEDRRRGGEVLFLLYDAERDPTGGQAKQVQVSGRRVIDLDRRLQVADGTRRVLIEQLRIRRRPSHSHAAEAAVHYQIQDQETQEAILRAGGEPKQVRGIGFGNWVMALKQTRSKSSVAAARG